MEDYNGPTEIIQLKLKKVSKKVESETMTDPVNYKEGGNDPMECYNKRVQTDEVKAIERKLDTVILDENVINMIMDTVRRNNEKPNLLRRLNAFHERDSVSLTLIKQFEIPKDEGLGFHSIICGPNNRMAFIYAERYHETWCSHNGVVIFWQRKVLDRMTFSSCPTCLRYGPQGLVAVALHTGEIMITHNGEILSRNEVHDLAITSMEWLSRQQLVTSSLDGRLKILSLKRTLFVEERNKMISIADIPREIRKDNKSQKPAGLTAMCIAKDRIIVGGETGALWTAMLPDLNLSQLAFEFDCIEALEYILDRLLVCTAFGKVKVLSLDGTLLRTLEDNMRYARATTTGLVFTSDCNQLVVYDLGRYERLMRQSLPHTTFTLDDDEKVIIVDERMLVSVYKSYCE